MRLRFRGPWWDAAESVEATSTAPLAPAVHPLRSSQDVNEQLQFTPSTVLMKMCRIDSTFPAVPDGFQRPRSFPTAADLGQGPSLTTLIAAHVPHSWQSKTCCDGTGNHDKSEEYLSDRSSFSLWETSAQMPSECCVVAADPGSDLAEWPDLPRILLTDRDARERLLSLDQDCIFDTRTDNATLLAKSQLRDRPFFAEGVQRGPSLGRVLSLMTTARNVAKNELDDDGSITAGSGGGESACEEPAGSDKLEAFEYISLDLDEEVSLQFMEGPRELRGLRNPKRSTDEYRSGVLEVTASSRRKSIWRALDILHMLKQPHEQPLSAPFVAGDTAIHRFGVSAVSEPRLARIDASAYSISPSRPVAAGTSNLGGVWAGRGRDEFKWEPCSSSGRRVFAGSDAREKGFPRIDTDCFEITEEISLTSFTRNVGLIRALWTLTNRMQLWPQAPPAVVRIKRSTCGDESAAYPMVRHRMLPTRPQFIPLGLRRMKEPDLTKIDNDPSTGAPRHRTDGGACVWTPLWKAMTRAVADGALEELESTPLTRSQLACTAIPPSAFPRTDPRHVLPQQRAADRTGVGSHIHGWACEDLLRRKNAVLKKCSEKMTRLLTQLRQRHLPALAPSVSQRQPSQPTANPSPSGMALSPKSSLPIQQAIPPNAQSGEVAPAFEESSRTAKRDFATVSDSANRSTEPAVTPTINLKCKAPPVQLQPLGKWQRSTGPSGGDARTFSESSAAFSEVEQMPIKSCGQTNEHIDIMLQHEPCRDESKPSGTKAATPSGDDTRPATSAAAEAGENESEEDPPQSAATVRRSSVGDLHCLQLKVRSNQDGNEGPYLQQPLWKQRASLQRSGLSRLSPPTGGFHASGGEDHLQDRTRSPGSADADVLIKPLLEQVTRRESVGVSTESLRQITAETGHAEDGDDEAIKACMTRKQRDILSMLRAGDVGAAATIAGGGKNTGKGCGKAATNLLAVSYVNLSPRPQLSYPGERSSASLVSSPSGRHRTASSTAEGQQSIIQNGEMLMHVVVSEEFVSRGKGSILLALRADRRRSSGTLERAWPSDGRPQSFSADALPRCQLLELSVEPPIDLIIGSRSAVIILDGRDDYVRGMKGGAVDAEDASSSGGSSASEASWVEKFRLLTQQTLKYSTIWLLARMDKALGMGLQVSGALQKLDQWMVGFPCRVEIRYSHNEAQLAELIAHAAAAELRGGRGGLVSASASRVSPEESKRRRVDSCLVRDRSPLEGIENFTRNDPEFGRFHFRQAWFLQLFPTLNAYSASALLSAVSLKHLIISPYEELAPVLVGGKNVSNEGKGAFSEKRVGEGGATRGGVDALCLRDFCEAVRYEGAQRADDHMDET